MKKSTYEMVTDRIIEELQKGNIPWQKPWSGTHDGAFNRVSKKPYSLLNQMILKHTGGEYATFKQWSDLGGKIKKGEKSEIVVFWKILPIEETKEDGTKETVQVYYLKYYNVFHISQVEGVEPLSIDFKQHEPIENAEQLLINYVTRESIRLEHTVSNEAYYSPIRDLIHLPLKEQFVNIEEYYSTAFHEATHSTMKETRCNRESDRKGKLVAFGSDEYTKEELIAEIGSANILNRLGIETSKTFKNSTAYIQNWIQVLKNDVKFIVSASSKAEKAVSYIFNDAEETA